MQENLDVVIQRTENVVNLHQERIDNALEDYLTAISEQFVETNTTLEKFRTDLTSHFEETRQNFEKKVQLEVQNLFSAQSLENGFVWQNLANQCNQNFAATLDACVAKANQQILEGSDAKIAQAGAAMQGKLVESTGNLKAWFIQELMRFDQGLNLRLERIDVAQAEMRAEITRNSHWQRDFEARFERKMAANDQNVLSCLTGMHTIGQKVVSEGNSQVLAEIRTEIARVQNEQVERARREGELHAKVQTLEKKSERMNVPPPCPGAPPAGPSSFGPPSHPCVRLPAQASAWGVRTGPSHPHCCAPPPLICRFWNWSPFLQIWRRGGGVSRWIC